MKKLYFLDEEEKNRILNLHETATKKHYLSEQPTLKLGNLDINIPLHYYAALRFLKFSKTTLTESEINQKTLNDISNVLCEKSARMKTCNPSQWRGNDPRGGTNKNSLRY
jgi:hypothetical protein